MLSNNGKVEARKIHDITGLYLDISGPVASKPYKD